LAVPGFSGVATDRGHETSEQHVGTHAAAEHRRAAHGPRRPAQLAQHDATCQVLAIALDGACRALAPASSHPPRCWLTRTDATCHTAQSMDEQASFQKNINMLNARLRSEQQKNKMHQTTVRTGGSRCARMCVCVCAQCGPAWHARSLTHVVSADCSTAGQRARVWFRDWGCDGIFSPGALSLSSSRFFILSPSRPPRPRSRYHLLRFSRCLL